MTTVTDQIAAVLASFGAGGVAVIMATVPVAVAIAVYITRMGSQAKIDRLEGELARSASQTADAMNKQAEKLEDLERRYHALLQAGAVISNALQQIESDVSEIATQVDATDYSILVPAPTSIPGDQTDQLVFLLVSGKQVAVLRWVRVPVSRSMAGQVFRIGRPTITQQPKPEETFSGRTDKVSSFRTEELLSIPLMYRTVCVGVAQFLNKRGERPFSSEDIERAQNWSLVLARRVAEFVEDPRRLAALGHAPRQNRIRATIMFVDMSNFGQLFNELDASVITDLVNQYFQELCSIGLRHGGSIDNFLGDGFMMAFNVNQSLENHAEVAVRAAWEMMQTFSGLRERWVTLGYRGTARNFVRIGLELGPVTKAEVGHLQHRRLTVMGAVVNTAAHLCNFGPRDRDVVLLGEGLRQALDPSVGSRPLTAPGEGQVQAHEVTAVA